jgi:hypothetical protein
MAMSDVSAASRMGGVTPAQSRSSVALSSTLARCQQQLGDWLGCPSAKTPEGKKIIDNLRFRIARLEDQVARSSPTNRAAAPVAPNSESGTAPAASPRPSTRGGLLNLYA